MQAPPEVGINGGRNGGCEATRLNVLPKTERLYNSMNS
jgi:hypothetical protein